MKTFYRLLGVAFIAITTTNFVLFALTFWAYLTTKSVISTSVMAGVYLVATALSANWFGSIVDRYKKKHAMIGSSLATLLLFTSGLVLFYLSTEADSEVLAPQAKSSLDVVARALASDKLADFRFLVEGHADPRGGHEHNMQLSQARAESVVNYLSAKHGISRERLKPEGKGDTELRNTVKIDAAENRRVTIKRIE